MNEYLLRPFLLWSQEIFGFGSYGLYGLKNGSSKKFQFSIKNPVTPLKSAKKPHRYLCTKLGLVA